MATYRLGEHVFADDHPDFQLTAARAHRQHLRPLCLCREDGLEMYVARIRDKYILKRMPETGSQHALTCASYEPPAVLSGLGEVIGSAIQSNHEDGTTTLRFDFSMTRKKPVTAAGGTAGECASSQVRSDGSRLSLRGVLHYLWSEAGLHRWVPAMVGKRTWSVIHKYLLRAACDKVVRGQALDGLLYVPEPFVLAEKDAILARRMAMFEHARQYGASARSLMLLVGEIKEIKDARYGKKIIIRHLPDCPFLLRSDIGEGLSRRFKNELELWSAFDDVRLMVCGTFGVTISGVPMIEELTLMLVNAQWLPFENCYEKTLLDRLVEERRRFEKCLRYNLAADKPLAAAVLSDTKEAVALYLVPPGSTLNVDEAIAQMREHCSFAAWVWDCSESALPALPSI
ncbi:MAG: DUF1173 domain-containing protein [Pseudomonadota bacterium]